MEPAPPDPNDAPDALYRHARLLYARYEEKRRVIARIREYVEPWRRDKRMKVMGEILLREIDRIEREEAERRPPE